MQISGDCSVGGMNNHHEIGKKGNTNGFIVNKAVQNGSKDLEVCRHCIEDKRSIHDCAPPFWSTLVIYLSYVILVVVGYTREILLKFGLDSAHSTKEKNRHGYVPLYQDFSSMYTRHLYRRIKDVFNRPVTTSPGAVVTLQDRETLDYGWTFRHTGSTTKCINMGSYNYLGFAENKGYCCDQAENTLKDAGVSLCSSRRELGNYAIHKELEDSVARFLGVDAAIVFGMGFATNSMNLPCLVDKGCLVLSDQLNHSSLVLGQKLSGATVRVFKHNNIKDLEAKLKNAIVYGQPRSYRPWKKIVIVVEGVYSMEGDIVKLPEIIRLKKQYKAYLYLDEAHSVGSMGRRGRGVMDYWGCNPKDIDALMGTFTKSFNGAGGYIAGSHSLIRHLKVTSHAHCYSTSMAPSVARQILATLHIIMGESLPGEGQRRLRALAKNTRYFRKHLKRRGFIIYGNEDSPVIPLLLFHIAKISAMVRGLLDHQVVTVGVGFPAVPLVETRARFCMSASHTKEMIDEVLKALDDTGTKIGVKYRDRPPCSCPIVYDAL